jgi:hypothetical protein
MSTVNHSVPACLTRDNLTSLYFPNLSMAGLAAVIALGIVFLLTSFNRLNHTDLWGHLNFGRWMANHHTLPIHDPFAAAPASTPVLNAAWLSQRAGYEVQGLFGNEGLALSHALLVTLIAGVLMLAAYRRGMPAIWAWSAGIVFLLLDLPIAGTIRPQLFGQLGAALCLLACAEMPQRKHPLLWLPLVGALWVNLHGSILMGLAILVIYAAGTSWNAFHESQGNWQALLKDRRLQIVWGAVLLTLAGACLNPHGPVLLGRTLLFNEHAALSSISEWRPLTPGSLTGVLMIASALATIALFKYSPRKWEMYEILLLVVFGLATFPAIRMLAWWAVVWPWVCLPHVVAMWRKHVAEKTGEPVVDRDEPTAMRTVLAMGFVFMLLIIAPPSFSIVSGHGRGEGPIMVTDTPLYVADELVRRNLTGTIAAPMDWADFLVWKTEGRVKPLVHSHVHLTEIDTWRDYEAIYRGDKDWLDVLRRQNMQHVLVARGRYPQLARAVLLANRDEAGVRIIYQDQRCVLAEVLPAEKVEVKAPAGSNDLFLPPKQE